MSKLHFDLEVRVEAVLGEISLEEFVENAEPYIVDKSLEGDVYSVVIKSANNLRHRDGTWWKTKYLFVLEVSAAVDTRNFDRWVEQLEVKFKNSEVKVKTKVTFNPCIS